MFVIDFKANCPHFLLWETLIFEQGRQKKNTMTANWSKWERERERERERKLEYYIDSGHRVAAAAADKGLFSLDL